MVTTIGHKGITLAFEDRGAGKPAFVFVHGWTCDRSSFAPQAIAHPSPTGRALFTAASLRRVRRKASPPCGQYGRPYPPLSDQIDHFVLHHRISKFNSDAEFVFNENGNGVSHEGGFPLRFDARNDSSASPQLDRLTIDKLFYMRQSVFVIRRFKFFAAGDVPFFV